MKTIWFAIPFILIGTIAISESFSEETKTFFISPSLVDCVGIAAQKCLQIREDETSDWQNFYDSIEGFAFEQGHSYKILVKLTDIENPPADSSNKKYALIDILEKTSTRHIPYKNMCAPGFVPLGEICVLDDRCGPGAYPGKVCVMNGQEKPYLRPLLQGEAGIPAHSVICAEKLTLIFKSNDGSPACVKQQSVQTLQTRGWQINFPNFACTLEYAPICGVDGKTYGNTCMITSEHIAINHVGECSE
ncbi:DUF4377 domain-containing protein, partial [Nitrosopumilus adriaticus]|uniref:Beta-lactamase domain-containing protein n=1 Tax=Nitrosopumilus adriaticus TaxID=1580092 RepID=A0A0D5C0X6_9ARCH